MSYRYDRRGGRRWFSTAVIGLSLLFLILILTPAGSAEEAGYLIQLQTADIVLRPGVYDVGGSRYAVVKLRHNLRRAEVDALSAAGVRLVSYLGDGVFIAGIDPGALSADVSRTYGIEAATAWMAENKATLAVRQGIIDDQARTESGQLKLSILFFPDVTRQNMEAILGRHAQSYQLDVPPLLWTATIGPERLKDLLREEGIHTVEPALPLQPVMDEARTLVHADEVQQAKISSDKKNITYNGLTGKGVTLQVSECVYDDHPDFQDQQGKSRFSYATNWCTWEMSHGTSVAGIMAGNGKQSTQLQNTPFHGEIGRWRGVAPEAMLYEDEYMGGQGRQVDASNHSSIWREAFEVVRGILPGYGSRGAAVDQQIRGDFDPDLRWPQIWAAGNNGLVPSHDNEEGYYAIGSPAKNNVVVGSVNANDGGLSQFSSLGPTFDGRLKPDVVAPGGKNHIPPNFDLALDRINVAIDYIRVVNKKTGSVDAAWEFNKDGDQEGWFVGKDKFNVFNLAVSGGFLTFELGVGPDYKGNQSPWGWWDGNMSLAANENHVILMRYRMTMPEVSTAAGSAFWFHRKGDTFSNISGEWHFPITANDSWNIAEVPVGQWGLEYANTFTGWRGKIDRLGMILFEYNAPKLISPAAYVTKNGQDFYAYRGSQGTSEAAPVVTGSVALILQQFHKQFGTNIRNDPPLPATIKAILIQTAEDLVHETADPRDWNNPDTGAPVLYYEGPDFATGYGLINVRAAVDFIAADPGPGQDTRLIHKGELDGYEKHIYELFLTADDIARMGNELKFTLVWDDYPGEPTLAQTTPKLVNDLDLVLIDPVGAVHLPWVLYPLPVAECGGAGPGCGDRDPIEPSNVKPAYKGSDRLNNVEMVQTGALTPGRWLLVVSAYKMPMPLQRYSLVGSAPIRFVQGGGWVDMGAVNDTVPPGLGHAYEPALALSPNGAPYVAWTDYASGNGEIYVKEWQNGAWVEKGSGSAKGGGISNTPDDSILAALTVASDGSPIVAWEERKEKTSEIYAKWWKDGAWKELGSVSGDSGSAFPGAATRPAVAYSQDLGPIVAWHNYHTWQKNKGAYAIYVKHWDGDSWEEMDSGSASGIGVNRTYENAFSPSLAVHKQDIYIAWANEITGGKSEIYVKRWNSLHWVAVGGSAHFGGVSKTTGGDSWRPSLIIDPNTWQPVVAWEDNSRGNYEIYLKKWNNNHNVLAWEEMDGSASGGGISVTGMDSKWPSLAIGSDGLPVVTWQEETIWSEVYGKRWDGDSWEGIGGSAFGGGISDCGAITSKPSLAVGASGAPFVAFHCGIAEDYDVYVRRWQAASPPSPPPPDGPYLAINHELGAPGSFFTLTGGDFPAGKEAAVTVNQHDMGTVAVNSEGAFEFVLSTAGADEGHYLVTASVNPSAGTEFTLAAGEPVWLQEGTGPVMEVPPGIAFMERLFLPVCAR